MSDSEQFTAWEGPQPIKMTRDDVFTGEAPQPEPETTQEAQPEPFTVVLWFRDGQAHEFEVTFFDIKPDRRTGRIYDAAWRQESAVPGDTLLRWVDWDEVRLVTVRSIEP